MNVQRMSWPKRFIRWIFGGPFQRLPPQFGSMVPPDLQQFEDRAAAARHAGMGRAAQQVPVRHAKTQPARVDSSLERQ